MPEVVHELIVRELILLLEIGLDQLFLNEIFLEISNIYFRYVLVQLYLPLVQYQPLLATTVNLLAASTTRDLLI